MSINFRLIGRRIKESRLQQGVTQAELAEKIEMSETYISHIETARKKASLETLVRIANALGITADRLLEGNQTNDPAEYRSDLVRLTEHCTSPEKRIIYDIVVATVKSLRDNKS